MSAAAPARSSRPRSLGGAWALIADLEVQLAVARADAAQANARADDQALQLLPLVRRAERQQIELHALRLLKGVGRPALAAVAVEAEVRHA